MYLEWGEVVEGLKPWEAAFRVYRENVGILENGHLDVRATLDLLIRMGPGGEILTLVGNLADSTFPTLGIVLSVTPNLCVGDDQLASWWSALTLRVGKKADLGGLLGEIRLAHHLPISHVRGGEEVLGPPVLRGEVAHSWGSRFRLPHAVFHLPRGRGSPPPNPEILVETLEQAELSLL